MGIIRSQWASVPISIENNLNDDLWSDSLDSKMSIPGGFLMAKNDLRFLYMAIDLIEDTNNDPGTKDYFWLSFDKDRNRSITPNVDVNFAPFRDQPNKLGRQLYLGPERWTGLLNDSSESECKSTFEASPNSATAHRIWKLKLALSEIERFSILPFPVFRLKRFLKFGVRVNSENPQFRHDSPENFSRNFRNLHTLYLSRKASIPTTQVGPLIGGVGVIPFTKIDKSTGKATTDSGYMVKVTKAAFRGNLNIIGNRTKINQLYSSGFKDYKILHKSPGSGTHSDLVISWKNYQWNGSEYELNLFAPDSSNKYKLPDPAIDYSIDDLLFQLQSDDYATGLHEFKIEFYNGSNKFNPDPDEIEDFVLKIYIDNNIPEVSLKSIKHNGSEVNACAIVNLTSATDGLEIDFEAFDQEGNMNAYALFARWGEGHSAIIKSANYDDLGSDPDSWQGSHNISASWTPRTTCAHSIEVVATARSTNGYGGYSGKNAAYRYVTIIKP